MLCVFSTCAFYACTYYQFNLCVFSTCASYLQILRMYLLLYQLVHFQHMCALQNTPITRSPCTFSALVHQTCAFYAHTQILIEELIYNTFSMKPLMQYPRDLQPKRILGLKIVVMKHTAEKSGEKGNHTRCNKCLHTQCTLFWTIPF